MTKIILDLCGGTGAWSRPYAEAGYDVRVVTLPEQDVRTYNPPDEVYGILAAPPCTQFSYARTNAKTMRDLQGGMELVEACLRIIWKAQYIPVSNYHKFTRLKFWAMENPYYGFLAQFIGRPAFIFDPYEFGDAYKKRTAIWGNFRAPNRFPKQMTFEEAGLMVRTCKTNSRELPKFDQLKNHEISPAHVGVLSRSARRAITPAGFARAFFEANP